MSVGDYYTYKTDVGGMNDIVILQFYLASIDDKVVTIKDLHQLSEETLYEITTPRQENEHFAVFKSNPTDAEVWLDGTLIGRTPIGVTLIEGKHTVEVNKNGYEKVSKELTFTAGSASSRSFSLDRTTGDLKVSSVPTGAKLYVDSVYKGTTPLTLEDIQPDVYNLELVKEGYEEYSTSVSIGTSRTTVISAELTEKQELFPIASIIFVFFLFAGIVVKRKSSGSKLKMDKAIENKFPKETKTYSDPVLSTSKSKNGAISEKPSVSKIGISNTPNDKKIIVKSGFRYKGAIIQYKVKVENPTSEPAGDVKINIYVPDVFILSESTKSIPIIKPSESKTVTFNIRPTGECGDCQVSGKVVYYDYKIRENTETAIPPRNVSIVCPMLRSKEITEGEWRNTLSGLTKAEETTKGIDMPASTLFDITSDVLQDMNLFKLEPKVNDSDNLYRAVAKFYSEGIKSLKYAAQIEVVGGPSKSKLILKAWAESEDALTGFYHGILDEIEKRVHVKGLIENIVVNNYHYGDNISTHITDSVVQRSFNKNGEIHKEPTPQERTFPTVGKQVRYDNRTNISKNTILNSNDFMSELLLELGDAENEGKPHIDVRSGDLHKVVGNYPGPHHRMPVCCNVMRQMMVEGDEILEQPPKGNGANLVIRYHLPRE